VSHWATGSHLRTLFVTALIHSDLTQPCEIWKQFREKICDDLPYRLRTRSDIPPHLVNPHLDLGLHLINKQLASYGKTVQDFLLPSIQGQWDTTTDNPLIEEQLQYDVAQEDAEARHIFAQFNAQQRANFTKVVEAIAADPTTAHFFLQGPAGTGKTFLYRGLCSHFRAQRKIVLCVASSGIAALLLPGGRTAHTRFKIPLNADN